MLLMRPCILTPTHVTTNDTCAQSLLVASRTGRATRMDDIEVPFIGNNICYAHASPHSTGTACTRFFSPVRSVVYVSFCPAVWVIGPGLRWPYRNRCGVVVWRGVLAAHLHSRHHHSHSVVIRLFSFAIKIRDGGRLGVWVHDLWWCGDDG